MNAAAKELKQAPPSPIPEGDRIFNVAAQDAAEEILRGWDAFDFDGFSASGGVAQFLEAPFGDRKGCYTPSRLAQTLEARDAGDSAAWEQAGRHLADCRDCRQGFEEWQATQERIRRRLRAEAIAVPKPELCIHSPAALDLREGRQTIEFIVTAKTDFREEFGELDRAALLCGALEAAGELRSLKNPRDFGAGLAICARFEIEWKLKSADGFGAHFCDQVGIRLRTEQGEEFAARRLMLIRQLVFAAAPA